MTRRATISKRGKGDAKKESSVKEKEVSEVKPKAIRMNKEKRVRSQKRKTFKVLDNGKKKNSPEKVRIAHACVACNSLDERSEIKGCVLGGDGSNKMRNEGEEGKGGGRKKGGWKQEKVGNTHLAQNILISMCVKRCRSGDPCAMR